VIFGVSANVSITKLFLAGHLARHPASAAGAVGHMVAGPRAAKRLEPPPRKSKARIVTAAFRKARLGADALPLIILVGLRMGVFTPTEAAVVAAVYRAVRLDRHLR
jgi:TRAP-type C4-dicarboxylate transport system permease large subunit